LRIAVLAAAYVAASSPAGASSAIATIAPEIARALGPLPSNATIIASPLTSDVSAPRGDELAVRVASLIAGQLGGSARASAHTEPLSVAQGLAAKGGVLVYVEVEVAHGQLRATADLYPVLSNGWDRVRAPLAAPRAHAFASAPVDAEVRTYLPPLTLQQVAVHKIKLDLGEVLAAACGDLDGDGGNELVLVTRKSVVWGRALSGAFVATRAAPWDALALRVPVPFREPLATAAVVPRRDGDGGDLFVGSTDRGGVALSRDLLGASPLLGLPVVVGEHALCLRPSPPLFSFDGGFIDCIQGKRAANSLPPGRYDGIAATDLIGKDGASRGLVAARDPSGTLHLRAGEDTATLDGVGSQVALGDLDEDGVVEVVTTAGSGEDAILISSWRGRELAPRMRIAAPAGVKALSVCPPEDAGVRALVAVVGSEVWIVR
jgi:hypothetical protein